MGDSPAQVARFAEELLARHAPAHRLHLQIERCAVRVQSNSSELIRALAWYFRTFASEECEQYDIDVIALEASTPDLKLDLVENPPGPGKTLVKEEYIDLPDGRVVHKCRTGMLFLFGGGVNLGVGPCLANQNQVVNFINNRLIQWMVERQYLLCHASAVCQADRGVCIAGVSGRGKSTLALHLMERGLDFVTNDRLLIGEMDGAVEMLGLPKYPRVNPGTILNLPSLYNLLDPDERDRFEALSGDELWELEHKFDVDVNEVFGDDRLRLVSQLVGVVLLNWERSAEPLRARQVDLSARRDLLRALMKSTGVHFHLPPGGLRPDQSEDAYLNMLRGCPAIEMTGGVDFAAAADECLRLIEVAPQFARPAPAR